MMKKIVFLLVMITGFTYAYAQQGKTPLTAEQKADEVVAKLKNQIQLTEEQTPKVKAITLERVNKVTEATKKYGKDKNRLKAANTLIFDDWEKQLKSLVSEDQFNKYLAGKGGQ